MEAEEIFDSVGRCNYRRKIGDDPHGLRGQFKSMRSRVTASWLTRSEAPHRVLNANTVPEYLKKVHYAVRGELVQRAEKYDKQLKADPNSLPFKRITYCNIGNPQQLGQKPLTFFRQVLSLVEYPDLLKNEHAKKIFPADAFRRAEMILKKGGPTGAYSGSKGLEYVREGVARFIAKRDGKETASYTNVDDIFLTDGASPAVQLGLRFAIRGPQDGIMIPIPQYPLYSASIPLFGGSPVPYYLDESRGWALDAKELARSVAEARKNGINPRGLVVINPGNPTGACLPRKNIEEVIDFCHREGILIFADEVYQENVYVKETKPFVSFKKVLTEMGKKYANQELMSFHSISKGFLGECGKRGGYVEFMGIAPEVKEELYKMVSIALCPNVTGQIVVSLMVEPPAKGDESYDLYVKERDDIYNSLKRRADLIVNSLNKLPSIECQPAEGAMYAFPTIKLPAKVVETAKKSGRPADTFYCIDLLDKTGLCVVPGSGFGQREGTFHFRTTFLPKEEHLTEVLKDFAKFHTDFLAKYNH